MSEGEKKKLIFFLGTVRAPVIHLALDKRNPASARSDWEIKLLHSSKSYFIIPSHAPQRLNPSAKRPKESSFTGTSDLYFVSITVDA